MSKAVALPENNFRLNILVRHDTILEASDQAAIRHDTSGKIDRYRALTNREDNLVV